MFDKFKWYLRWRRRRGIVTEAIGYLYQEVGLLDLHEYCMLRDIIKRFKREILKGKL